MVRVGDRSCAVTGLRCERGAAALGPRRRERCRGACRRPAAACLAPRAEPPLGTRGSRGGPPAAGPRAVTEPAPPRNSRRDVARPGLPDGPAQARPVGRSPPGEPVAARRTAAAPGPGRGGPTAGRGTRGRTVKCKYIAQLASLAFRVFVRSLEDEMVARESTDACIVRQIDCARTRRLCKNT